MPANILQEIVGITVALIILYATSFKRQLEKNHLLPDFKHEMLSKKPADEPQEETEDEHTEENGDE